MEYEQAQELVKKLYEELTEERTPNPEDVKQLGDFMSGKKLKVAFLGEYEVQYDPKAELLEISYYGPELDGDYVARKPEQGNLFGHLETSNL